MQVATLLVLPSPLLPRLTRLAGPALSLAPLASHWPHVSVEAGWPPDWLDYTVSLLGDGWEPDKHHETLFSVLLGGLQQFSLSLVNVSQAISQPSQPV